MNFLFWKKKKLVKKDGLKINHEVPKKPLSAAEICAACVFTPVLNFKNHQPERLNELALKKDAKV